MIKWLYKVNKAFDILLPGPRFLTFIIVVSPGVIAMNCEGLGPAWFFSGLVYSLFLIAVRYIHITGRLKKWAGA